MKLANLALRFVLELCALAALGYWGATARGPTAVRVALAVGAPLLMAAVWGTLIAPKAPIVLPSVVRMLLGLAVFGVAAVALSARGQGRLATLFLALAVLNVILMLAWQQDRMVSRDAP